MLCPKCGAENEEGVKLCKSCGASFAEDATGPTGTSIGLDQNVAAMLSYLFGWLSGLIILSLEKKNDFVRFHAMQSVVTFGGLTAIAVLVVMLSWLPWLAGPALFLTGLFGGLFFVLWFVIWVLLMFKAYRGRRYKLIWAGNFAERYM